LALVFGIGACSDPQGPDPFVSGENSVVYREVQCVHSQPDGTCNKMTCKKDDTSDCSVFVKACLKNDHHVSGTSGEASCSRIL
jgi:hypothetical protein